MDRTGNEKLEGTRADNNLVSYAKEENRRLKGNWPIDLI
jgi:hypothetical protein